MGRMQYGRVGSCGDYGCNERDSWNTLSTFIYSSRVESQYR